MSTETDLTSDQMFKRAGGRSFAVACALTALIVWTTASLPIWQIVVIASLVFGLSFGFALWILSDPIGFLKSILSNLTSI